MDVQTETNQLLEVALRIRELREVVGLTPAEMAQRTGIGEAQYREYEQGSADLPFTFLHKCALAFGVELTELLEGRDPRLSSYTVTRSGQGLVTASEEGIEIRNMAAMFRQKLATPYYVTYQYSEELQDQPIHTTTHSGQEFDLNEHVMEIDIQGKTLVIKVKCNNQGTTISPFVIYAGLLGITIDPTKLDEVSRRFLVAKTAIIW